MVQDDVELVDGTGTKGVTDFRPVDGDPYRPLFPRPVIGDIGERQSVSAGDFPPHQGIEQFGDKPFVGHAPTLRPASRLN